MGATCGCGDEKDVINEVSTDPVSLFFIRNIELSFELVSGLRKDSGIHSNVMFFICSI
jgi:hypothetical protein